MALIKFEEDIKSALEKRRIEPSKISWETLENSLDKDLGKRKKKSFWWMGVAASLIGILWISISFFESNNEVVEPTIVEVPHDNIDTPTELISNQKSDKIIEEDVLLKEQTIVVNQELVLAEVPPKNIKKDKPLEIQKNSNVEKDNVIAKSKDKIPIPISDEEKQLQEVAAQIAALEKENATEAEIDNLLKNAQQKIRGQKFKESGMSVSAYSLLAEVEEEIDPSFRDKVFKIVSENYQSIKNVVAQRND